MVKVGLDTWFFYQVKKENPKALKVLEKIKNGTHVAIVSSIALFEIFLQFLKQGESRSIKEFKDICEEFENFEVISPSIDISDSAARYRHSLACPDADALILATCIKENCDVVISECRHFKKAKEQNIIDVVGLEKFLEKYN